VKTATGQALRQRYLMANSDKPAAKRPEFTVAVRKDDGFHEIGASCEKRAGTNVLSTAKPSTLLGGLSALEAPTVTSTTRGRENQPKSRARKNFPPCPIAHYPQMLHFFHS
jgi:hypothetical protein